MLEGRGIKAVIKKRNKYKEIKKKNLKVKLLVKSMIM